MCVFVLYRSLLLNYHHRQFQGPECRGEAGVTGLLWAHGSSINPFSTIRALLSLLAACHLSLLGEITHIV